MLTCNQISGQSNPHQNRNHHPRYTNSECTGRQRSQNQRTHRCNPEEIQLRCELILNTSLQYLNFLKPCYKVLSWYSSSSAFLSSKLGQLFSIKSSQLEPIEFEKRCKVESKIKGSPLKYRDKLMHYHTTSISDVELVFRKVLSSCTPKKLPREDCVLLLSANLSDINLSAVLL